MKKVAVVILNWNGVKLLQKFLPSVIEFSDLATIYVADNDSTDASIDVIKNQFPMVKIIQNDTNYGYAKGYNVALKNIEEPYYALVNSDIEVTKNWLVAVLSIFENENQIAIIQPKILDYNRKDYFEYAGAAGGFIDKYGYPFCRGRIFNTVEKDIGQYDDQREIFWASGACFFIRKEVFRKLNGFDSSFFAHQEEIDLCWRAFNLGFKVKYTSKTIVYHIGGATLNESNPKKTYLNFRNSLIMLTKNLPKNKLVFILLVRMFLDGVAGIQFLLKGKFSHFIAILNAHCSFYALIYNILSSRFGEKKYNYFYINSIVVNYFLKNETKFSET